MKDLSVKYLGLQLKNPIIVGSCGLTHSVAKIKELADNHAAAVVLKSLFEEQIHAELKSNLESYYTDYPEASDYVRAYTRGNAVQEYITLISEVKNTVDIPVIASINCVSGDEWVSFARSIEQAGADALELNISLLPSNPRLTSEEHENLYSSIVDKIAAKVSIPIALKISKYSSSLANLVTRLSWKEKIHGFVLFNRFFNPDVDIDALRVKPAEIFTTPEQSADTLRWIALLSGVIEKDLVASTGIHDSTGLIKQLLVGASAVQVVSTLYKNGPGQIGLMLDGLSKWMEEKSYNGIADFRGKLSYEQAENPAAFERIQFMKYYGGIA
ncbi:dihydroorotate dehydrogenase-like protein [Desulfoprunum benzoelyticum]|uniref:Dihydroorotate dehydrogenase (Fumarate) n=1 Tax=Desulfoprunum benzoelyticum TaxID=1506996 RepID=A0A840UQR5_9BACT|nr:dihydroorotate dehydrogenase-like protein [Desulfoprunum benzoelyticum]MBB5348132.1 dihydroorotate dehydrogenase (fumarate) [Desulfoprunum benzoelyticum]MBM9530258.1 dihydroorotate dehydrogenase-like protein [Desulfoprunum benzoelyticum]